MNDKGPEGSKGPSLTEDQRARVMGGVREDTERIFRRNERRERLRDNVISAAMLVSVVAMILGALGHRLGLW
jgi:hypothetical protein